MNLHMKHFLILLSLLPLRSGSVAAFVGQTFQTDEGSISNVVLLSESYHPEVIAHEFLHAFGLVDLYPSESELKQPDKSKW